jgi:hypothetical protein
MKKQKSRSQSILAVAAVTGLLLLIPLIAMQFTDQVVWTASDFIVAGALLFAIGSSYVLATRTAPNIVYRAAMGLGLAATLFMIWANLAVGLIGGGPNPGNLMYIVVVFVGVIGTFRSRLESRGMEHVMYAMALALVFITAIALMTGMDRYPGSSMYEILTVNAFLATPFIIAGLLFRYAAPEQTPALGK